jgi:hypothetical protein
MTLVCPTPNIMIGCACKDNDGLEEVVWFYSPAKEYIKNTSKCPTDREKVTFP